MFQGLITRASMIFIASMVISYGTNTYAAQRIQAGITQFTYVVMDAFIAILTPLASKLYGERTALQCQIEALDTEILDTEILDTEALDTEALNTEILETEALDTEALDTEALDTEALDSEQRQKEYEYLEHAKKQKDREIIGIVNWTLVLASVFMEVLSLLLYLFGGWITNRYTHDPATLHLVQIMFLVSVLSTAPFACYSVIYRGALAAVEDRKGCMIQVLIATVGWVAAVLVVKQAGWGLHVLLITFILFDYLRGMLVAIRFYTKQWI
jgi:Na+-driven multidrug efflux pump